MENTQSDVAENNIKPAKAILIRKEYESTISLHGKAGLLNIRAIIFLLLWYLFSGCTLFLNKYILTFLKGDPTILGMNLFIIF